jgi:mannosyltransferase
MEAAEALDRASLSGYLDELRAAVRARSRVFWIVAGLSLLAAGLRFATLGVQSYHHDEIVTVSRILPGSFVAAMEAVGFSESAPPLYYALAWVWTQLTGTGEFGLRSLSALAGVATVPIAYLIGAELANRRAGIAAAALVAVNPMLLWYSQEARAYSLLVLLCAISALYFVRALDGGRKRDFLAWGIASALALATHYFAVFPIAAEALWLLRRRGRDSVAGLWIVALAGLALAPLAIHQMSIGHAEWIGNHALAHRLWETGATFMVGETGEIIARPETPLPALAPFLFAVAAIVLAFVRGTGRERRGATVVLVLAAVTVALPVVLALVSASKDYVLARNLIPALVPLLVAAAIGATAAGARRAGMVVGAALFVYSLGFCVLASVSPSLQRPDWNAVASRLGEPAAPRAMVTWALGEASLRYYLDTGAYQVFPSEGYGWLVHEVDFVSDGPMPPVAPSLLGPGFRQVGYEKIGRLYERRYALPGPRLARLRLHKLQQAPINFRSTGVLLDGIGPGG